MNEAIVLAYSGGPAASAAMASLVAQRGAAVVAMTLDLGQSRDVEELRDRALAEGAVRAHVLDVREEFAREFVLPALQAGALGAGRDPLAAALAGPMIAKKLVEVAGIEQAATVAHGAAGAGAARIAHGVAALNPRIRVAAPPAGPPPTACHTSSNLWGRSATGGALDDPWAPVPEEVFTATKAAGDAPGTPAYVEISFEVGVPIAINGIAMSLTELVESLSIIAGQHGVGRVDVIEDGGAGGSRRVYEAPAAIVLHAAHRELQTCAVPRELAQLTRELGVRYADLIHHGRWFTPMREALDAFTASAQQKVTGMVRVKLFKGQHTIDGRRCGARS